MTITIFHNGRIKRIFFRRRLCLQGIINIYVTCTAESITTRWCSVIRTTHRVAGTTGKHSEFVIEFETYMNYRFLGCQNKFVFSMVVEKRRTLVSVELTFKYVRIRVSECRTCWPQCVRRVT